MTDIKEEVMKENGIFDKIFIQFIKETATSQFILDMMERKVYTGSELWLNQNYLKDLIKKSFQEGKSQREKEILEIIDNEIDHYEPYRLITDSLEAKEVRKALEKVKSKIKGVKLK